MSDEEVLEIRNPKLLDIMESRLNLRKLQFSLGPGCGAVSPLNPTADTFQPTAPVVIPSNAIPKTEVRKERFHIGDNGVMSMLAPRDPVFPPPPFFVQFKSFDKKGHLAYFTIIDANIWNLHAIAMKWVQCDLEAGKLTQMSMTEISEGHCVIAARPIDSSDPESRKVVFRGTVEKLEDGQVHVFDLDYVETTTVSPSDVYVMTPEACLVPFMSFIAEIDKLQLFSETDSAFLAYNDSKDDLRTTVFMAAVSPNKNSSPRIHTLQLWTPERQNVGDIFLEKLFFLLSVPLPKEGYEMPINITHYTEAGEIYYQASFHQNKVIEIIENFDIFIRRELPTIKALFPNYSNRESVNEKFANDSYVFAVPYSGDGRYYRARVLKIYPQEDMAHVHFIDYGNDENVPIKSLLLLDKFDEGILFIPPMARKIKVADLSRLGSNMDTLMDGEYQFTLKLVPKRENSDAGREAIVMARLDNKILSLREALELLK